MPTAQQDDTADLPNLNDTDVSSERSDSPIEQYLNSTYSSDSQIEFIKRRASVVTGSGLGLHNRDIALMLKRADSSQEQNSESTEINTNRSAQLHNQTSTTATESTDAPVNVYDRSIAKALEIWSNLEMKEDVVHGEAQLPPLQDQVLTDLVRMCQFAYGI